MEDRQFLEQALMQSFLHPVVRPHCGLYFLNNAAISDQYIIASADAHYFPPLFLPLKYFKRQQPHITRTIKQSSDTMAQYEILKHDVRENIIIPENGNNLNQLKEQFDLPIINRESAQRKKVSATIFPTYFSAEYKKIVKNHHELTTMLCNYVHDNNEAWNIVLIQEFHQNCQRILRKFHYGYFAYWINKKRFLSYLCEAIQYLKLYPTLPEDFLHTHTFRLQKKYFFAKSVQHCYADLQHLLYLLQTMSGQKELLDLAQNSLAGAKIYATNFSTYRKLHTNIALEQAKKIYTLAQQLSDLYATLAYFDGVILAFENHFLAACPESRHQPLPTVSPEDELKKIRKIIAESQKIKPLDGFISKRYIATLKKYLQVSSFLQKSISAHNSSNCAD